MNFGLSALHGRRGGAADRGQPVRLARRAGRAAGEIAQTDIYSLGAVLFEMLTGRQRARGLVLSAINPDVPAELEQIVARMLAANVENRAQSAATIAAELRSIAAILDTRTEAAEAASASEPVHRRAGRKRSGIVFAIISPWSLLGALAAWLW